MKITLDTTEMSTGNLYKFSDNPNYLFVELENIGKAEKRITNHFTNGKDLILSDIATIVKI